MSELLAAELDVAGSRDRVESAYGRFLELNGELLSVCTDWQVVGVDGEQAVNDHSDAGHDARSSPASTLLHVDVLPITDDLGAALDRFAAYSSRLSSARTSECVAGEHDWFTRPTIDSYHTVWFELHEDLLATLGRRTGPGAPMTQQHRAHELPQRTRRPNGVRP